MERYDDYYGRLWTKQSLPDAVKDSVMPLSSFVEENGRTVCQRCASPLEQEAWLPAGDYYCRFCLVFGRNRSSQDLYYLPQKPFLPCQALNWKGQLTTYQAEVSEKLLEAWANKQSSLVHAVTGAGKTEMIYALVDKVLSQGGSVALVSPRIDVCNELYQRFSRDFTCPLVLLHSESDAYRCSPLVIATVHQLFKFYRAFDVIVVDEVDAFPYVDNPSLYRAVDNALKTDGLRFFLTATSTDNLDKEVRQGKLNLLHLARRFHGNPLVVPKPVWLSSLLENLQKAKLPQKLYRYLTKQRQTGFPLLIFFPHIELGQVFADLLQSLFPDERVGFVSSQTENRLEVVESFRQKKVTILVSTTILERGVTFPCVDVFVLWANHRLYSKSSLVQIGGRVGRSMERPTGELLFFHDGQTMAMRKAIAEIKAMNSKGGF